MARTMSFVGVNEDTATYKLATGITSADEGKAVALTDDSTVGLGSDGDALEGKLLKVESDGYGTVQIGGFLVLPYKTGVVPTLKGKVVVDGAGNVKDYATDTATNAALGSGKVVSLDTTNKKATVRFPA